MITHDSFDALSVTLDGDDGRSDVVVNRVHPTKAATLNAVYAMIRIRDVLVRFQIDGGATCNVLRLEDLSHDLRPCCTISNRAIITNV